MNVTIDLYLSFIGVIHSIFFVIYLPQATVFVATRFYVGLEHHRDLIQLWTGILLCIRLVAFDVYTMLPYVWKCDWGSPRVVAVALNVVAVMLRCSCACSVQYVCGVSRVELVQYVCGVSRVELVQYVCGVSRVELVQYVCGVSRVELVPYVCGVSRVELVQYVCGVSRVELVQYVCGVVE